MLDYRLETFLTLCKLRNYTRTAEALSLTQPAVTQHIKFLEEYYRAKLFSYNGRVLTMTSHGEILYGFAMAMKSGSDRVRLMMGEREELPLTFGATLTIGEYAMPPIIGGLLEEYPRLRLTMLVRNTKMLLEKLCDGALDFAILEGSFDKSRYRSLLFSREPFVALCSPKSPLAKRSVGFEELLRERLLVREKGSGSRDILEQALLERSLTLQSFGRVTQVGNINAIKRVAEQDKGITFLYRAAAERELFEGRLCEIAIDGFQETREFNFVFLRGSLHEEEYERWHGIFRELKRRGQK